jgi:hypothetical protein
VSKKLKDRRNTTNIEFANLFGILSSLVVGFAYAAFRQQNQSYESRGTGSVAKHFGGEIIT